MPLTKLSFSPGICKLDSEYEAAGRWIDGDNVRFVHGLPQKLGGWDKFYGSAITGKTRGLHAWQDNNQTKRLAIGTHKKLFVYRAAILYDITPLRTLASGTLTNPIATTSGSKTVTVTSTAHKQAVGDMVQLQATDTVGGLIIKGQYIVASVPTANTFTFTHSTAASSTVAAGGGATTYAYTRAALANPFSTVAGSSTVTVTHTAHGLGTDDTVHFAGGSAVGGLTITGEYAVTVLSSDTYSITAGTAASSSATGGGAVTYQFELAVGRDDALDARGWGVGVYGASTYGSARNAAIQISARTWYLDNYGQNLLACPRNGSIYEWNPDLESRAYPVLNAPTNNVGMLVTEERMVFALGADGDRMAWAWCDQLDNTIWTATDTNTAGTSPPISGGSEIIGGVKLQGNLALIMTDTSVFASQYTGDAFVYATRRLSGAAGLFGPNAVVEYAGAAYWMSDSDFWIYDGQVRALPSNDIRSYVFDDINRVQRSKCFAGINKDHREVWFFYCSAASNEIDRCVFFSLTEGTWSIGQMARTAWEAKGLYPNPILAGADGYLYAHESGVDADGAAMASYLTSAPRDISDGNENMDILMLIPDFKAQVGAVDFYVLTKYYPNLAVTTNGPYTALPSSDNIDVRCDGRQAAIKIESNALGGNWRLGQLRVEIQASGGR